MGLKKILEHPIISAVIAGLILSSLGLVTGVLETAWAWLMDSAIQLFSFLATSVEVPLWILLIISIPLLSLLIRGSIWLFKKLLDTDSAVRGSNIENLSAAPEEVTLTEDEYSILRLLVQKDGAPAEYSDFKYQLQIPKLRAQQMLESLIGLGFVKVHDDWVRGTQIYLTREGRDFVIGNKYSRT